MSAVLSRYALLAWFMVVGSTSNLSAQLWEAGAPGDDVASVALSVGMVSPRTTLPDGSSFENGIALGLAGTWWGHRYFGLRAAVLRSETNGVHGAELSGVGFQDPTIWLVDADVLLRLPFDGGRFTWFPYVAAGVGLKSYRWTITNTRRGDTSLGDVIWAAGLEFRPGGNGWYGLKLEAKNHNSQYEFQEFIKNAQDMNDLVFTAAITLNR